MKMIKRPPGPEPHLLLGNLREVQRDLLSFLLHCGRDYGDIAFARIGFTYIYLVNHPDLIHDVLVTHSDSFHKDDFFWGTVKAVFGNGLLTSEGEFWKRQRRLIQPLFHAEHMGPYADIAVTNAEKMISEWSDGDHIDIHERMIVLTMQTITRALLGTDIASESPKVADAFTLVLQEIARRFREAIHIPDWVPTPRNITYRRSLAILDDLIFRIIEERRRDPASTDDLVTRLVMAKDIDGRSMSAGQTRDEVMTLFLAGHETTAIALAWTWYLLSKNPEAEEKFSDELKTVLNGRVPTFNDLSRLVYTSKVVTEALRLYPPAYVFGRKAIEDLELGSYLIPAGSTVYTSSWVIHRDPRFYPDPERFDPDRWDEKFARSLPKFAYFPFGGGPRVCIGRSLALTEAVLVLATIGRKFRVSYNGATEPVPFQSMVLLPRDGMPVVVRARGMSS